MWNVLEKQGFACYPTTCSASWNPRFMNSYWRLKKRSFGECERLLDIIKYDLSVKGERIELTGRFREIIRRHLQSGPLRRVVARWQGRWGRTPRRSQGQGTFSRCTVLYTFSIWPQPAPYVIMLAHLHTTFSLVYFWSLATTRTRFFITPIYSSLIKNILYHTLRFNHL